MNPSSQVKHTTIINILINGDRQEASMEHSTTESLWWECDQTNNTPVFWGEIAIVSDYFDCELIPATEKACLTILSFV